MIVSSAAQTNTFVIPRETENNFGTAYSDPFFISSGNQQVYAASEFADLPVDVIAITEIALRVNESSTSGLDATLPSLNLQLNIFPGSLEEARTNKDAIVPPVSVVFQATNINLVGRLGLVEAFDIRFPFNKPFVYDRKQGHLVIQINSSQSPSGKVAAIDAHGITDSFGGIAFNRGFLIVPQFMASPNVRPSINVTKFFYIVPPIITAIRRESGLIIIHFSLAGESGMLRIETSDIVDGPFSVNENAEIIELTPETFEARLPVSPENQFLRIRVD